jgi:hypothetical protein
MSFLLLPLIAMTLAIDCPTQMSACSDRNTACVLGTPLINGTTPNLLALCDCNRESRDCFSKLQTDCPLARNSTAIFADLCVTGKCGAKCDGAPYFNCDMPKILSCSRQAAACQEAPSANNCTCLAAMRSCVGDSQLSTCGFWKSFFPEIVTQCTSANCPASCGAVAGCDFELAAKCSVRSACTADPNSCACLQAKHECLTPIAQKCDVIRGGLIADLQSQCVRANCSTSCSNALPTTTCVSGSLVLSPTPTDTCNSCTCKDGKATACTRKRCAAQCKGVTECRAKGDICIKDVKMCLLPPCPQYRCIDPSAPAARNDENFDGDEIDDTIVSPAEGSAVINVIATSVVAFAVIVVRI